MTVQIESIGFGVDTSAVKTADKDLDSLGNTADKTSRKADDLTTSVGSLAKGFLGASAALAGLAKLTSTLDEYTKYTAILRNATGSQNEFNAALSDVRRIANTAQTDVAGLATTYARFNNALKEYGVNQKQVATLTETVALGLKANGASAEETSSAMLQLSQAFGSGKLSGDEFASMAESAPNLMRALAASIGVPRGALKDMAAQGLITNEVMLKAFTDPKLSAELKRQAEQITTLSGAWQVLKNEISGIFSDLEEATGFFKSLAISTKQLGEGIGIIRGFFKGDQIAGLNAELKKATDRLETFDRGNAFDQAVMGGKERRAEMLADVKRLSDELSKLTKKAPVNPASLTTMAVIDTTWMDKQQKAFDKILKHNQDNAEKLKELQDDIYIEFHQEERERIEKTEKIKRDLLAETYQEEDKRLDDKAKKAKKFAEYQAKLEDDLNKTSQKYINMQEDAQLSGIVKRKEILKKEAQRIEDNLSRSISDALMRGFDSGKSFVDNFIDTLKNAFKTLVLQPAIEFVLRGSGISGALAGIGGLFSGNAGAADVYGTTGIAGTGGGYDLVKGITRGFDGINSTFQSSIESLGAYLAESNYGLIKDLGGMIGQYSSQIANIAPYAGAALQLLSGDVKGALFTGAGTAIGTYFGGSFGGAIGAALGGAVGGLFGSKKRTPRYSSGVATTYNNGSFSSQNLYGLNGFNKDAGGRDSLSSAAEVFSSTVSDLLKSFGISSTIGTQLEFYKRKGAWGKGSITVDGVQAAGIGGGSKSSIYSKDTQTAFNNLVNALLTTGITNALKASKLPEGIKALFDNITDKTVMGNLIKATQNLASAQDALLNRYGLSLDLAGKVATATGLTNDELASFVNTLAAASLATQKTSVGMIKERDALKDLIGSLPSSVDAFDAVLKSINTTTEDGQKQFADLFQLRDRFAQYTSTFDAAVKNVDSAIYGLLSPSEQLALDQSNLAKAFAELNLTVPSSIQDLIDLGKSIDYSTESGLDLALAFPALVDMFNKTKESVNSLTSDLNAQYFSTRADFLSAQASNDPSMFIKQQAQTNSDLLLEIKQLKSDNANLQAIMITVAEYTFKQSRVLDDWDANGMPTERTA